MLLALFWAVMLATGVDIIFDMEFIDDLCDQATCIEGHQTWRGIPGNLQIVHVYI